MLKNYQEFLVQKIRSQYTEKQHTELDELKALDKKFKKPAQVFSYIFGSVGTIIMGAGMSLIMTDMGSAFGISSMVPGIIIGIVGMAIAIVNYPIYKNMLAKRKAEYSQQIIELSEKLMANN